MKAPRITLAVTALATTFLAGPMIMTLLAGTERNIFAGPGGGLTTQWLRMALNDYASSIGLSLMIAALCLISTILLGVPCAYALSRAEGRFYRFLERLLLIPLAMPGLTLAMAMVQSYSAWHALRQSPLFILAGHVLVTLPLMVAAVRGVMTVDDSKPCEDAAASLGAGFIRRFVDIILPACRPGIIAGGLQVVTTSIGEFNLTWLLRTPDNATLPTALADAYATSRLELASAYSGLFFLIILPALLLVQRLAMRGKPVPEMIA